MSCPPEPPGAALSGSQVKKAGDHLRHALRESSLAAIHKDPENEWAWEIVRRFQAAHVQPTATLVREIRTVLGGTAVSDPVPRIKRVERIIEKIARESSSLHRLQDIGGCRLIVTDMAKQMDVAAALRALPHELVRFDDYASEEGRSPFPGCEGGSRGSGYRAIHLVHRIAGRLLETQIRTPLQHAWAVAAERSEQITGYPLKFGEGPPELLEYFRVAAQWLALQEWGRAVDAELVDELAVLRERIRPYYRGSGSQA